MARILVVDDQQSVRRLLVHMLGIHGHEVIEAEDGSSALRVLSEPEDRPDLCILDVMMPGMDGWEILRTIRASATTRDLPVVMLTAKGRAQDRLHGWELGCDAYIPKPFDPSECAAEVHAVLARSEEQRVGLRERQLSVARAMASGSSARTG